MTESRPPFPPFEEQTALQKVQAAEDAWNTKDPHRVALAYTPDSVWRNRDLFLTGRDEIVEFLTAKWAKELDYVLRKSLWAFEEDRIAVRFQYEWHDTAAQWYRSYGNELWEFDDNGLMRRREASINDVRIAEGERRWLGPRGDDEVSRASRSHFAEQASNRGHDLTYAARCSPVSVDFASTSWAGVPSKTTRPPP